MLCLCFFSEQNANKYLQKKKINDTLQQFLHDISFAIYQAIPRSKFLEKKEIKVKKSETLWQFISFYTHFISCRNPNYQENLPKVSISLLLKNQKQHLYQCLVIRITLAAWAGSLMQIPQKEQDMIQHRLVCLMYKLKTTSYTF